VPVHNENAPSRWPLRPASQLTFAEASADRGAINLRRSVLGAHGNLERGDHIVKCPSGAITAICIHFQITMRIPRQPRESSRYSRRERRQAKYARTTKSTGAVAPSSGFLTDLRRSECRSGDHRPQVLLPRCNHNARLWPRSSQDRFYPRFRKLRSFHQSQSVIARSAGCSKRMGPRIRRAGSPSSTTPGDLPLPRTASR
jgi:hypothetical protein